MPRANHRGAGAGFRIKLDDGGWLEADQVVVACERTAVGPAAGVDGRLAELLGTVPYSSSMTVAGPSDAADFAGLQGHPAHRFRVPVPKGSAGGWWPAPG